MRRYLVYRVLSIAVTLLFVSLFVFCMMERTEGDVTSYLFGDVISENIHDAAEEGSFLMRYFLFMRSFISLRWGESAAGWDIRELIASRLPVTLALAFFSLLLTFLIVFPLSMHYALRRSPVSGRMLSAISAAGYSMPSFLIAFILVLVFSYSLKLFPIAGYSRNGLLGYIRSLFLPSLTVAAVQSSLYARMIPVALSCSADYITASKGWGMSDREVLYKEALRPALPVIISLVFQSLASGLAGSAVVENVFALPGIGSLLVSAALSRDVRLLGISLLLLSCAVSLLFMLSELLSAAADPRSGRHYA